MSCARAKVGNTHDSWTLCGQACSKVWRFQFKAMKAILRFWTRSSPRRMLKFPVDAPKRRVVRALEALGFRKVREREHISMVRENPDGTRTPLTIPNHNRIKASTLRTICTQSGIAR